MFWDILLPYNSHLCIRGCCDSSLMPVLELAYQVPSADGGYLKRQGFITLTKCFESTVQRKVRSGQNEAERLNACTAGEALCDREEVSSGRSTSRFMVCLRILVLLQFQNLKPRGKQTWKKCLGCIRRSSSSCWQYSGATGLHVSSDGG